jgi:hypothetical protein
MSKTETQTDLKNKDTQTAQKRLALTGGNIILPYRRRKMTEIESDLSVRQTLILHKSFLKLLSSITAVINESSSILIGGGGRVGGA